MSEMLDGVTWFRGPSVRVRRENLVVHVDPIGVSDDFEADYILLTHPHYDNFSEPDIDRIRGAHTVVIAPASMKKLVDDADHFLRPGDLLQLDGLDILAVPAYNVDKRFHPPDAGWLGYVFSVGAVTYYHAGDTDFLPAMLDIKCDVAFLPCGGHYTMGPEDAARAATACGASVLVPIQWGEPHAALKDVERLRDLFDGEVHILERHV